MKMKRIIGLALACLMVFTLTAFADDYDLLASNYTSYDADVSITIDFGNSAQFLNAMARELYFGETNFVDFDLLFATLNELECSGKVKLDANEDYSKINLSYEIKTTVPLMMNRNLKVTSEIMYAMWMNWDITDPSNPKMEYIYSVPFQDKYFVIDALNAPGLSESDRANMISSMKKTLNKDYIDTVNKEMLKSYRENSTITFRSGKSIITFDKQGMNNVVADTVDIISQTLGSDAAYAELAETGDAPSFPTKEQTAEFLNKYNVFADDAMVIEITKTSGGALSAVNAKVNFAIDIAKLTADYDYETVPGTPDVLSFSVAANTAYSSLNKKVSVDFPELTEDNSVNLSDYPQVDYNWGGDNCEHYEYIYLYCDYIPSVQGTCYASLDEFVSSADRYGYDYDIVNNGGTVTLTDKNGKENFKLVTMTVGSAELDIDGVKMNALNPVVEKDGEIYVDTEAIKYIFNADMSYMQVYMDSNEEDINFGRRSPQCPHADDYDYNYNEEYDAEEYCEHYQSGYFISDMPYAGIKYVLLNDIVSRFCGDFTVERADGVTTLTVGDGQEKFKTVRFGEGNTDMTVDGVWETADEPTVVFDGRLYIPVSTAKKVFGFDVSSESLRFRWGYMDENGDIMLPSALYYDAYFERKNPSCKHTDEEIKNDTAYGYYPRG